jgi:twitching motility protein PilT
MASLDSFFKAMIDYQATEFVIQNDQEPQFEIGGVRQNVSKQKFSRQEVMAYLGEIMPEPARERLMAEPSVNFSYSPAGMGSFTGTVNMDGGGIRAVFTPGGSPGGTSRAAASPSAAVDSPDRDRDDRPYRGEEPAAQASPTAPAAGPGGQARFTAQYREAEIDKLLKLLVQKKGSDLHLSSLEHPVFRIDGDIRKQTDFPMTQPGDAERLLLEIMPERHRKEFESDYDTDLAYEIPGLARFRVNIFLDRHGMGGVFRVIPSKTITVEDLNLSQAIQNLCYLNKGLVLVTGPTGSGKSTTLCALVDLINRTRECHIITLEDPIEFVHNNKKSLINQREVGAHTMSFKNALRAALREDPNVVLVGEMRDLETISIAIETAETGHLVFGTLHTSTAASTVDRVIEQFPPDRQEQIRIMLSESLKGVVSQTLCKKIGGGRIAALEVMLGIPAVANLIRESKTFQLPSIIQTNRKMGMVLLNDSLMEVVNKKLVEPKEAYIKSMDKLDMANQLKRDGHSTAFLDEVK